MKKLFALLLAGVMAFGMMACGNDNDPPAPIPAEAIYAMDAPIDALARCMLEQGLTYDAKDPEFIWTALFYFTGAYGLEHPLVTENESYQLAVPAAVMQEHASALFAAYDDLPELPAIMEGNISYDETTDTYLVSRGDIGLSEIKLENIIETEDGYELTAELWGTDPNSEMIASYDVSLTENAYAKGIEEPLYLYSVVSIVMEEPAKEEADHKEESPYPDAVEETAIFNGLADSHTVEAELSKGIATFQFAPDSDVAESLSDLEEGDNFTFYYKTDANGVPYIVGVQ